MDTRSNGSGNPHNHDSSALHCIAPQSCELRGARRIAVDCSDIIVSACFGSNNTERAPVGGDAPQQVAVAPVGAAFLSYASEDARDAQRIAEVLWQAGVEVWFDREELRGGDAWDQKIRQQIRDCRLFLPIISAHSEARLEGYFRREWKLACDRTDDMASEVAFLEPISKLLEQDA